MGDIAGMLNTVGTDVMGGIGDVGKFIGQGVGDISGFLNPGSLNAAGSALTNATSAGDMGVNAVANVADQAGAGAAAPMSAASALTGPGVDLSSINPQAVMSGIGGAAPPATMLDPATGMVSAAPTLSDAPLATSAAFTSPVGINQAVAADVGQGISTVPGLPGGSNWLQSLLQNPQLSKLLPALIPGAATALGATQKPPGLGAIQEMEREQAGLAKNQGALAAGEQAGMLPAGYQGMYQQMLSANEAAIRANYAERGLTGSTAELKDLEKARSDVQFQMMQAGQNMAKDAWTNYGNATGYQSKLLDLIMQTQMGQQEDFRQALADMSAAFTK